MLVDKQIWELIHEQKLIEIPEEYRDYNILTEDTPISRGVSSCGYDLTLAEKFAFFNPIGIADPLRFDTRSTKIEQVTSFDPIIIPGNGFTLAHSVEVVNIPEGVCATAVGKSTYARCGLIVNVTPIEPGFSGQVTLELHNASPKPVKVYPLMGICQLQFHRLEEYPMHSYKNKMDGKPGKYQYQMGITFPKGAAL